MKKTLSLILRLLTILALSNGILFSQTAVKNFHKDLTGWWRGEDNANDSHSNNRNSNNHGRIEGKVEYGPGKIGQAFKFNNKTYPGKVVITNPISGPEILPTSMGTVSLWVNWSFRTVGENEIIFGGCYRLTDAPSCSSRTPILMTSDYSAVWLFGEKYANHDTYDDASRCYGMYPLPVRYPIMREGREIWFEQWHHLALTYRIRENSNFYDISFYVDGRKRGSQCDANFALGNARMYPAFAIGQGENINTVPGFNGQVDEMRTYRRDLNEHEIEAIYKFER